VETELLKICVPATSANLGPGFDTLGLALKMKNCVDIKPSKFFSVSIKGEGADNPKMKGNNLFINIFNEHYRNIVGKNSKTKFKFTFHNNIPMSRGLGSSSAVIVSALASACEAAGVTVIKNKLLNSALLYEPHPDNIAPATMGGFTVSILDQQKVFTQKKKLPPYLKALVVIPNQTISTSQSRTTLPKVYNKEKAIFNLSHSSFLTGAFFNEDWDLLKLASKDKFHQKQRMKNLPELFTVQKIALEHGALMSTLSGSGSTFFNLMYKEDIMPLKNRFESLFPNYTIRVLDFDNEGLQIFK
jgi:homoserine kinase